MPLIRSKFKKAMSENIKSEMDAGKPQNQALAIAYDVKRRAAMKKAKGGMIKPNVDERDSMELDMLANRPNMSDDELEAMHESMADADDAKTDRDEMMMMAKGGSIAEKILRKKMASGGEVDLDHNSDEDLNLEDQLSFEAARKHTYFDDEQVEDQPMDSNEHGHKMDDEHDMSMVDKIRMKRKKMI